MDKDERARRIKEGRCTYRDCSRKAHLAHTTCKMHYSAGRSMAQEVMSRKQTTQSRDIRLTAGELELARDAMTHRRLELERRLKRSSYAGKPGMLESVLTELEATRELERTFAHAYQTIRRQAVAALRENLEMTHERRDELITDALGIAPGETLRIELEP